MGGAADVCFRPRGNWDWQALKVLDAEINYSVSEHPHVHENKTHEHLWQINFYYWQLTLKYSH